MNALLGIAADFLERIADPAYGKESNEGYSLRFATLLDSDPNFARQLANVDVKAEDLTSLSLAGWLWYLRWRGPLSEQLPSSEFLDALYDATAEPIVRLRVVDAVVSHPATRPSTTVAQETADRGQGLARLPDGWLRRRMESLVRRERGAHDDDAANVDDDAANVDDDAANVDDDAANVNAAWELAVYLLELGDDVSVTALRALLDEPWRGNQVLTARVNQLLDRPGLNSAVVEQWRNQLGLHRRDQ
jgi:hypothetical protein